MNRKLSKQEEDIFNSLKAVIDPELMVNIVDLGLVYDVKLKEAEKRIEVEMTLTSPGCPLGEVITEDVRQFLQTNHPGWQVDIYLVWEPAWLLEMLTEKGKEYLGRK